MYIEVVQKRVPTTALPLLLTLKKKKDIRKCDSKVLKTFSYFFFVDALHTKQTSLYLVDKGF
jgi:hypothetical protein